MSLSNIGNLMYLYMDEIDPGEGTDAPEFLIKASVKILLEADGRNWVPVIVREVGTDQYEVIGNEFIYAIAEGTEIERIWCIIADSNEKTIELTRILTGQVTPKVDLSIASRDEIQAAFQYLIEKPGSFLKGVNLATATNHIDSAHRKNWATLDPITKLKCGITRGKKLDALKEVFYVTPSALKPEADESISAPDLKSLTVKQLRDMAKQQGLSRYSKKKKQELIEMLMDTK